MSNAKIYDPTTFIYQPPTEPLVVIYEDDYLIVVDKPAGLLSVPGRLAQHQDSAYYRVLALHPHAKVTHRLDMATSGLLLFAKQRQTEVAMSKLFQNREVQKYYVALVQGLAPEQGCIDVPLIADWPNRPKQKVDFTQGKMAKTLYKRLNYDQILDYSRLELQPITGRSHQLRIHTAYIGHPILGDNYYHPNPSACVLMRMALHATTLHFCHPITAVDLNLCAKVPF